MKVEHHDKGESLVGVRVRVRSEGGSVRVRTLLSISSNG